MKQVLLQIGKHSSVYMLAQVIMNGLSVLMLPIYVNYFSPAEIGCIALIDLSSMLLFAVLGVGILAALGRHHFEAESEDEQRVVWWTGYLFVTGLATVCLALVIPLADTLSFMLLGPEFANGPVWIRLAALSLWIDTQTLTVSAYLRVQKKSTVVMRQSIGRSLVFVVCAVTGIMFLRWGPTAQFASNAIASASLLTVQYGIIVRDWGRPRISKPVLAELWSYGWPLIFNALLINLMHQTNRWFVKEMLFMEQVGLLSLGLTVADKVNRLVVMPFQQIWNMLVFELHAEHPERAVRTFCFVFEVFCYALMLVFLGCAIAAEPVLTLIAREEYLASVPLIPILCLAQFCFALSDQFQAPIRLAKQTLLSVPAAAVGLGVACLANWMLISRFGVTGAAWATVATYFAFSGTNLLMSRQIEAYPYPFQRIGIVLAGICGTFLLFQSLQSQVPSTWISLGIGLTFWLLWGAGLAAVCRREYRAAATLDAIAESES